VNAKVAREYSKRLGTLSPAQFQAALDRFGLGEFVSAKPIPFGNFGQNVFLTSTKGDYVLRGAPHYPWQFPKERFFAQLLHERTPVPVPWPYLLDSLNDIFGWDYVLMPHMPGLQLIDPGARGALCTAHKRAIAEAMGTTLAHIHSLTWPYAGEYDLPMDTIQPLELDHADWVISRMRHDLQLAIPLSDRTTDADVEWVERVIEEGRKALAIPFVPCCVMQDFKEGNAVAECKDGVWQISGVFDLMESYFGDGEADLPRQVSVYADEDLELARNFVRAYREQMLGLDRPLRPGFAERFRIYMLLDRLIIWQFAQRHGVWWDPNLTLLEWAGPYVSLEVF
jgi:aminoglycoside phosphotransferase (APT) family kinase protein